MRRRLTAPPPAQPELPEAARPRWPPWYAPTALVGAFAAIVVAVFPVLPLVLIAGVNDVLAGVSTLLLLLVQDGLLVLAALLFAGLRLRPRAWHFGLRPTRFRPTAAWALLAFALVFGFELGYIALFHLTQAGVDDLGRGNVTAAVAVGLAVIVVAPVTEEFFFRAFFYRALRTRLPVWPAAMIDGAVFGALHFEGVDSALILPVIAVFGVGQCLVYERTGSLFAVIAVHAAFNTAASLDREPGVALAIGALVLAACVLVPRRLAPAPSPA